MIDVDLTGGWHTVKAVIPHLRAGGGGSIILTSSAVGLKAIPNTGQYNSAKHGMVGLMRTLGHLAGARRGERGPGPGHADRPPQSGRCW
jgi:NAD(P)-dependent dehydrogenase (short-subunit alcohol dehydrogenase family)